MTQQQYIQQFGIYYLPVESVESIFLQDDGEIESIDGYVESMNGRTATAFVLHYKRV